MRVQPTMHVKIIAPFKTYFDGPAVSLTGLNDTGPFDVLPHHKNFMSLLKRGTMTIKPPSQEEVKLPIIRGVLHVKTNQVIVFLDV